MVGLMIGMSGMGGGALMTPLLILAIGIRPVVAVGTDLAYAAITKMVGSVQHYRQRTLEPSIGKYLILGAVPASAAGVALILYLKLSQVGFVDAFISRFLAFLLLAVAAYLFIQPLTRSGRGVTSLGRPLFTPRRKAYTILLGVLVGFLVSITSIGSGVVLMPFLILLYQLPPNKLVGTNILFATAITGLTGSVYFFVGVVELTILSSLLIGSVPGVLIGSKLNHIVPVRLLRVVLASILMLAGLALMLKG